MQARKAALIAWPQGGMCTTDSATELVVLLSTESDVTLYGMHPNGELVLWLHVLHCENACNCALQFPASFGEVGRNFN